MSKTHEEMMAVLKSRGFIIGDRDQNLNTLHEGAFMVVEPFYESYLPNSGTTLDGRDGPWCIVGNDLSVLVSAAYESGIWEEYELTPEAA